MAPIKEQEKYMAAGVNISAIFFPYMGPIVGALIGSKSPFVKFHAFRNLIEQILTTLVIGTLMICSLAYSIYSLYHQMQDGFDLSKIDWVTLIVKSLVTWLLLALWGFINTILSIRDALAALQGKVPLKPKWSERKAMRWSGLDRSMMAVPLTENSRDEAGASPKML